MNKEISDPKTKIWRRTDGTTVLLHWLTAITLVISLATGLRIAADDMHNTWAYTIKFMLPQGEVIIWHTWAAISLLALCIGYIAFIFKSRLRDRITLDDYRLKMLTKGDRNESLRSANVVIYWIGFAALIVASVTGLSMFMLEGKIPYAAWSTIHQYAAWVLVFYVIFHVIAQWLFGGIRQLVKILLPTKAYMAAGIFALSVAGVSAIATYQLPRFAIEDLNVPLVSNGPILDGQADDEIWQSQTATEIATVRGMNLSDGESLVKVRAARDQSNFYALFQWQDSTRSFKHLPLIKGENGWQVMQTEFGIQDEDDYYEDKFAVMLANSPRIAGAGSTHLGDKPIDGKPGPAGGRGLHYTDDNSVVDVWHWKAVRSGSDDMQQIDDNFFGPPLEPKSGKKRYTGGYSKDPQESGGFSMNWESYSDDVILPKRLPKDPSVLERFKDFNPSPEHIDTVSLWMSMDESIPYDKSVDNYPVGTVMPSVLVDGPFIGDRGDVRSVAHWQDGWWTMEVMRKLDTESDYDVAISQNQPVYMWVAVFDHAQTRHSIHLHPLQIKLGDKDA